MCSWIGRLKCYITVKTSVFLKLIYRLDTIPVKTPEDIFAEINRPIFKFTQKSKESKMIKTDLKMNKVGRLILPNFKTYYKASIIKTVWYGC